MSATGKLTTPTQIDDEVLALLGLVGVNPKSAVWLPFTKPAEFVPEVRECHINAWLQWKYQESGRVAHGWLIWQHKASGTVEAHFHSVWQSDVGSLVDVTPREDGEPGVLFVPDPGRSVRLTDYQGRPALKTYTQVTMIGGQVVSPLRDAVAVLVTDLIYQHGLAVRPTAA